MAFQFKPFLTGQVALNAVTATQILPLNASRMSASILNTSSTITIYIGAAGVTSSTGYPLAPGAALSVPTTAAVYGVSASATPSAAYFEVQN